MNEGEENVAIEPGAPGAPDQPVGEEPTQQEIADLYKATGVKAPVPTGKAKGRPKAANVRDEDDDSKGAGNSDSSGKGKKEGDDDDKSKSKNAPASDKDGDSGDDSDASGKKVGKDSTEVSDKSKEADSGVHKSESEGEGVSKPGSEDDSDDGASGDESAKSDKDGEAEGKSDDEEGVKRPGKSNPEVEKRFQKLTEEKRLAEERAVELEKKLQEKEAREEAAKIAATDPEYTIEDFRKVRNNDTGEIIELDAEKAELAFRRWKDGYDARSEQRQAEANRKTTEAQRAEQMEQELIQESVKAYDTLAALQDEYPELVSTSDKFDEDFAADAMPIIEDALIYLEGTEPGNAENNLPVIIGMKFHPKKTLDALKRVSTKKRTLPLNGVNDNVEARSNVSVPHSSSSDPIIQGANELYEHFGIKKRL